MCRSIHSFLKMYFIDFRSLIYFIFYALCRVEGPLLRYLRDEAACSFHFPGNPVSDASTSFYCHNKVWRNSDILVLSGKLWRPFWVGHRSLMTTGFVKRYRMAQCDMFRPFWKVIIRNFKILEECLRTTHWKCVILSAFAELRKATRSFVMSVCSSVRVAHSSQRDEWRQFLTEVESKVL